MTMQLKPTNYLLMQTSDGNWHFEAGLNSVDFNNLREAVAYIEKEFPVDYIDVTGLNFHVFCVGYNLRATL